MVGLNPIIPDAEDLDLIKCDDQITFELGLDDDEGLSNEEGLGSFMFGEEYDKKEGGGGGRFMWRFWRKVTIGGRLEDPHLDANRCQLPFHLSRTRYKAKETHNEDKIDQ